MPRRRQNRLADAAAALGILAAFLHVRYYALTQISVLDEGAYLLKGLLYIDGVYAPFQDYGPLTNHMPLSFLLHGLVQAVAGPGLRAGRFFAVAMAILMLAGLWLLVRRLRGPWWAALAVWLVAVNPATARFYSLATTQAIIACLLIWTLTLAFYNPTPSILRLSAASVLAALMMLIRLNLAPVFVLLVLYVFWAHGRRAGLWALGAGGLVLAAGHAAFWPGILKIWAYWIPESLAPFLAPWRQPEAARFWDPQILPIQRLYSFLEGMRLHFAAVMGALAALVFWPGRARLRSVHEHRALIFTTVLFFVLLAEHMLAALGLSYCVFCFSVYLAFFAPVGILLLVWMLPHVLRADSPGRLVFALVLVVVFSLALGYGSFDHTGDALARLRLPRVRSWLSGSPAPGLPVWDVLATRFDLSYETTRRLLPALAGLSAGIVLAAAGFLGGRRSRQVAGSAFLALLAAGAVLSPTAALGDGFRTYDCGQDTLHGYEAVGRELAALLAPGEHVYWRGGKSAVPILYVPGAVVYPPQINGDYTIFDLTDSDTLLRFGLWSEALSGRWLEEADVVLIEAAAFSGSLRAAVEARDLVRVAETEPPFTCRPEPGILVFRPAAP